MLQDYQVLYLDNDIPINRSFYCNNGDIRTRGLEVHVLDNSMAKDCTGLSMKTIIRVPSGEMFEATVANGLVTVLNAATGIYQVLFPNNMGKGRLIAEIQLSNTVPEVIVSRKFSILGDGSLTSDGQINALPGAGLLYPIIAAEPARVTAEIARALAETTRAGFYTGFNSSLAAVTTQDILPSRLDDNINYLLGVEDLTLDWVLGSIQSGIINPLAKNGASTNNYIILDKDVKITLKGGSDCRFWVLKYTIAGVYTGVTTLYTANATISKETERKIRVNITYNDSRLMTDIYPIINNIAIIKENISVNKLDTRVKAIENVNEIPTHWQTHLADKIALITANQRNIGYNGTSFAFITDIHWDSNSQNSPKLLKKVVTDCSIPYVIDGGDISANPLGITKANHIIELQAVKKAYGMDDKILRAIGNHDDNSINNKFSMTVKDKEFYDLMYRDKSQYQKIKSGKTGAYHYVDDQKHEIRYIVLNAIDIPYAETASDGLLYTGMNNWAFRQEQIDWFSDVALNVPNANYSVVVCSHIPINQGLILNDSIATSILQAFKGKTTYTGSGNTGTDFAVSKTVDYTGKGGDVICWIAGHQHRDAYVTLPGNITYKMVVTLNDSLAAESGQAVKTLGTATENAFDIFAIDKINRLVSITRIGAGSDRSFTY